MTILINNTHAPVQTTAPALNLGEIQLSADRRTIKGETPLTDAQRIRRAVLPANHWGELTALLADKPSQALTDLLRTSLQSIGSSRLRDSLAENPLLTSVAISDYSVPALLAWQADTASTRGSITFTREQVENWFATSATRTSVLSKYADNPKRAAIITYIANRFATLSAKNHGLKEPTDTDKLLALIDTEDLAGKDAALLAEIVGRLEHINKALTSKVVSTDAVDMSDLD
jgi:hypothetical protein